MSKPYSEILSKELDRIDKEYSDPYVYASAMQEYIENKMSIISESLQDFSYISTLVDEDGKPYNIIGIMDSRRIGLLNNDVLPSGDNAEVTSYTSEELADLGSNYFSTRHLSSDDSNLLESLCDRVVIGENCMTCGSDLIRALVRQRDGLSNGNESLINTLDGNKLSGDNMLASIATQIGEFKVFAAGFKAVVESKTSSLSSAFSNNISLIADKFKDKSLSSIFYSLFNQAKGSAAQAVSGMMTLLTSSLKGALDSAQSDGSITNVYNVGSYSGLTFSSALGLADMTGFRTVMQNVVLAVAAAGYVVYNLIAKGFAMVSSAITKAVWKYLNVNSIEYKDDGTNGYLDFPIASFKYNINDNSLLEACGDVQILGSTYTIDSFYHYLTDNPEYPSEYGTSMKDIYNSLGDDSNHWMVDLKFALMFLSRIDGNIQMDIFIKPLVMDADYFRTTNYNGLNTWDTPAFNFAAKNFTAPLADGTEINITQSISWANSQICPARSFGRQATDPSNLVTGPRAMSYFPGYACDAEPNTQIAIQNQTTFTTPYGYYPRSVVNRIRSVFPIDGSKHWISDPTAFLNSRDWSNANWSDAKWILRENTQHEYIQFHWAVIALLTYLWLRINAYIPDWDTIITTTQGDQMHLAHVDINHGLWCYQVLGTGTNAQAHVCTVGALNVPGGGTVITYSSQISMNLSYATVDNTNPNVPITIFSRICNYCAAWTESPSWYYTNNDNQWEVPNNFLVQRFIFTSGTEVYSSSSDIGNLLTYKRATFIFGLSFFVGIWSQILLNKRENMSRVYSNWNDFPLFIPYNNVDQLPMAQYHMITSSELDSYAKVLPTIAIIAGVSIVAIAAIVTTAIVVKKKLSKSLELISVSSEAAKYAFEDDIKAFKNGEMDLDTFKQKSKDYLRITKKNKLKAKIYTALGAESISSSYYDLCSEDNEGSSLNESSSLTEQLSTSTDTIIESSTDNSQGIIHLISGI